MKSSVIIGVDALESHDLGDLLAQSGQPLPVAVLQRPSPVFPDHPGGGIRELVKWQIFKVGHTAGEGYDFRACGDGEERSGFGSTQAMSSSGVTIQPLIEPIAFHLVRVSHVVVLPGRIPPYESSLPW